MTIKRTMDDVAPVKPRLLPLPREEWTDAAREGFSFWGEPGAWENGSRTNILMVLAHHPELLMAYNHWGKHLLLNSSLPVRPRELVVMRTSWHLRAEYEWHFHVGYCVSAGMSLDEIHAIKSGPDDPIWQEADSCVLRAVDELWETSRLADDTWAALNRHLEKKQVMDLIFTIGQYVMTSWAISAFGIQLEDWVDKVDFDLNTKSGNPPGMRFRPGESDDWSTATDTPQ